MWSWRHARASDAAPYGHVNEDGLCRKLFVFERYAPDATVQCAFLASLEFPAQGFLYETCSDVRE